MAKKTKFFSYTEQGLPYIDGGPASQPQSPLHLWLAKNLKREDNKRDVKKGIHSHIFNLLKPF